MTNSPDSLSEASRSDQASPHSLRATLKRLVRMTAGYSLVSLMGPLFTILLTPLYTRALTPADYGVVDVLGALGGFIGLAVLLGIDQALGAFFFDGDTEHQRNLVTTAVVCVGSMSLVMGACLFLGAKPLAVGFFKDAGRAPLLQLMALGIVSGTIYPVIGSALRLRMSVKRVNVLALTSLLVTALSNVILVLILRLHATGVIAANVIVSLASCGMGIALAYKPLRGHFAPQLLRPLLRAGVGLVPGAVSSLALATIDRLLLTQYVMQTDLGLYAIANKTASLMLVMISPAWTAWFPMALEMAGQPDAPRQYARIFEYLAAGSMLLSLGLGFFAPEILAIFTTQAYTPAAPYALALTMYYGPALFLTNAFFIAFYVHKRTHLISVTYIIAAAVNVALNLLLNPYLGIWGATLATVLAGGALLLTAYLFSRRLMHVPYRLPLLSVLGIVYVALASIFLLTPVLSSLLVKIGALAAFALIIPAIGVVTPAEIRIGAQALHARLARLVAEHE